MIETMEVLVRQYELNSIDNNNSYTKRNRNRERNAKASVKREVEEARESEQTEQTEQQTEQTEQQTEQTEQTEINTQLFVPSENVMRSIASMVLSKGEHIGRGHTAYLTFATKLK